MSVLETAFAIFWLVGTGATVGVILAVAAALDDPRAGEIDATVLLVVFVLWPAILAFFAVIWAMRRLRKD